MSDGSETYDLALVQGEDFVRSFRWKVDGLVQPLGDWVVHSQIRSKEDTTSTLLLDLSSHMTKADDWITLSLPGTVTALLPVAAFRRGTASWDLFLRNLTTGRRERILQGAVSLDPAVTVIP